MRRSPIPNPTRSRDEVVLGNPRDTLDHTLEALVAGVATSSASTPPPAAPSPSGAASAFGREFGGRTNVARRREGAQPLLGSLRDLEGLDKRAHAIRIDPLTW